MISGLGMGRYHIFANMLILAFADTANTGYRYQWIKQLLSFPQYRQYRHIFLLANIDTADTEKSANMPIFPIPILVSDHPYSGPKN